MGVWYRSRAPGLGPRSRFTVHSLRRWPHGVATRLSTCLVWLRVRSVWCGGLVAERAAGRLPRVGVPAGHLASGPSARAAQLQVNTRHVETYLPHRGACNCKDEQKYAVWFEISSKHFVKFVRTSW